MFIIDGNPVFEEGGMDGYGIYLYVFCYLYFIKERTMDKLEEQLNMDRDPNIEINEDIRIFYGR